MTRILLIHRYFWPDSPPYAVILKEIAKLLEKNKYSVEVLASIPSYKSVDSTKKTAWVRQSNSKYGVTRLPVFNEARGKIFKLVNYIIFPLMTFLLLFITKKRDIVTVSSAPPVILAFLVTIACRIKKSSVVYHCMDMHPEIGQISGEFKSPRIFRFFMWMEKYTCRNAEKIIVLSSDMRDAMILRDPDLKSKIAIINNFSLPDQIDHKSMPGDYVKKDSVKRIIFAGNMGRFQGLDKVLMAFQAMVDDGSFELLFMGEGVMLNELKRMARRAENIRFIPHQPVSIAKALMRESDFGIVSLEDDVIRYAYPSKTMTYLECGLPILLFSSNESELSRFLISHRFGFSAPLDQLEKIQKMFRELAVASGNLNSKKEIADYYYHNYSQQVFNDRLLALLGSINEKI